MVLLHLDSSLPNQALVLSGVSYALLALIIMLGNSWVGLYTIIRVRNPTPRRDPRLCCCSLDILLHSSHAACADIVHVMQASNFLTAFSDKA